MATLIPGRETGYGTSRRALAGWRELGGYGTKKAGSYGEPVTLKDPAVYVKSSRNEGDFAFGKSWGVGCVRIGPGRALDILSKGIDPRYGITSQDILFLHLKDVLVLQC